MASTISENVNNTSQLVNSELWENVHFSSHEYVHINSSCEHGKHNPMLLDREGTWLNTLPGMDIKRN